MAHSTQAVVHFPNDYYGWLVHANVLAQLDREDDARKAVSQAVRLVPKLQLETAIARTEASYGRDEIQRKHLTSGLRSLIVPHG